MKRMVVFSMYVIALALCAVRSTRAQDAAGHFHFAGPMSTFMVAGATPGTSTSGIAFAVTLTDDGKTLSTGAFELKSPAFGGTIKLTLDGMKYADGKLTATVKVQNHAGKVIEGVRFDLTGVVEEYKARDAQGQPILKTRAQPGKLPTPLLFGDVPTGHDADPAGVEVSGISFTPDTTKVVASFALSGLAYAGSIDIPGAEVIQLDFDAMGRLYYGDVVGQRILRSNADGGNVETLAKSPQQIQGLAVDRVTGDIWMLCINENKFFRYSANGEDKGTLDWEKAGVDKFIHHLRTDKTGAILANGDGSVIIRMAGSKVSRKIEMLGNYELGAKLFDLDAAGNLWVAGFDSLHTAKGDGTGARMVASGPDWHMGRIYQAISCRVDASGNVYVTEYGKEGEEYYRVSVFDKTGKIVRVFGRGGKVPSQDAVLEGQTYRPTDIAFGPDGRVYVACINHGENNDKSVLMFKPF